MLPPVPLLALTVGYPVLAVGLMVFQVLVEDRPPVDSQGLVTPESAVPMVPVLALVEDRPLVESRVAASDDELG